MHRRILNLISVLFLLGGVAYAAPAYALTPTPSPEPAPQTIPTSAPTPVEELSTEEILTFAQIQAAQGGAEILRPLRGPVDALRLQFTLPPEWHFLSGARLELRGKSVISSLMPSQGALNFENVVAGNLNVVLNGVPLQTEFLSGNKAFSLRIPLNEEDLRTGDGAQELLLEWDASAGCTSNIASSVMWDLDSRFVLPHEIRAVEVDLSRFPAPFYQADALIPVEVGIVVPEKPGAAEIQAAAAAAAGFGRFSAGNAALALLTPAELNATVLEETYLIFIGAAGSFPEQAEALQSAFPQVPESGDGDGVIQAAVSPWNPARQVLWLHAGEPGGLVLAGEALSSGALFPLPGGKDVVVEAVSSGGPEGAYVEDRTFADFGMKGVTVTDFGSKTTRVPFTIPPGKTIGSEAYLDLVFNHSQMLDYLRSGIVVRLNGVPVGSARFSDTTAGLSTLRAMIPSTALRAGSNLLEVQTDILPRDVCSDPRLGSLWVTIFPNSLLHLPEVNQPAVASATSSLRDFALPFTRSSTLANLAYIVQDDSPASWKTAASLAFQFGAQTFGVLSAPAVFFTENVDLAALDGRDVLLIGQPSRLPMAELSAKLPVQFDQGDMLAKDVRLDVAFRIPQGMPIGYLAYTQAEDQALLGVLGNTEEGIRNASAVLLAPRSLEKLAGKNFAIVREQTVIGFSVAPEQAAAQMPGGEGGIIPGGGAPAAEPAGSEAPPADLGKPEGWILPSMVVSILLILITVVIQIRHEIKRRKM